MFFTLTLKHQKPFPLAQHWLPAGLHVDVQVGFKVDETLLRARRKETGCSQRKNGTDDG
uniref:Uncharacterized protein n=1 Tax=Arundo donax TaxID=35708 RepID=A0A0A9BNS3_ARUDO